MSFVNELSTLKKIVDDIIRRISRLETSQRFTLPNVANDPTIFRHGDMWLNTTTNLMKVVDKNGTVRVITWT
jgi:hypothetical protein